jgi:DNA-binding IclR family transcriptional regulator
VGSTLLHIGSSYLDLEANEPRLRALHWADTLASQACASVRIGTLHENLVLIVHQAFCPDDRLQRVPVGTLMPHATALGKALLAHSRAVAGEVAAGGLRSHTPDTLTDPDRLNDELDAVSERGWAGEVCEFLPDMASIAAPVESRENRVVGAIAISGPVERICADRSPRPELAAYVIDTATRISRELGGGPW